MDFKLKNPIQVMGEKGGKNEGQYEKRSDVVVLFVGKKGLKTLKSIQDVIFQTFQDTAGKSGEKKQEEEDKNKKTTVDEMLDMLDMTGNSERIFDRVTDSLKVFAKIGNVNLSENLQEQMDIDDLNGLYRGVLKSFLLPKITQQMNSMAK
jgi:hypothetical protein